MKSQIRQFNFERLLLVSSLVLAMVAGVLAIRRPGRIRRAESTRVAAPPSIHMAKPVDSSSGSRPAFDAVIDPEWMPNAESFATDSGEEASPFEGNDEVFELK